jgi:hypothetical protein
MANASVGGVSKYITTSGVYDVTIKTAWADEREDGSVNISFMLEHEGQIQPFFNAIRLKDAGGIDNKYQAPVFYRLMSMLDLEELATEKETIEFTNSKQTVDALVDLADVECKVWIKQAYFKTNTGAMKEAKTIQEFFTPEGASSDELRNGTKAGERLAATAKYHDNVGYKSVTKEEVDQWIADGRPKTAGAPATAGTTTGQPKFGKKFGKSA